MTDEIQLLPADQARTILDEAISDHLGDDWQDDENGWAVVTSDDYRVHLSRGEQNLEFAIAPQGAVVVEETRSGFWLEARRIATWTCIVVGEGLTLLAIRITGHL